MDNKKHGFIKKASKFTALLMIMAMLPVLCGCEHIRGRITDDIETADVVVTDVNGDLRDKYEKRRDDLDIEKSERSMFKNTSANTDKREKQKEETKEKEQTPKNTQQKTTKKTDSEQGNKKKNGSKSTSGDKTPGNGKNGNGSGSGTGTKKEITVMLDPNGGRCETSKIAVKYNGTYENLPLATREEYSFEGWYTGKDSGDLVTSETKVTVSKKHTLYAHWTEKIGQEYTVTFDPGEEARLKNKEKTRAMKTGDVFGTLPLPVKTGHDFDGWFTEPEGGSQITEGSSFEEEADTTFYAHWSYDPYKYWSQMRQTIYESMYACQVVDCYIEFEDHETVTKSDLLEGCKAGNCARNRGSDTTVTDEWVEGKNPKFIIKVTDRMGSAQAVKADMEERLPGRRILIVPYDAVSGSDSEQLYYKLYLGQLIYPDWFGDVDLDQAGNELGVSGIIYE